MHETHVRTDPAAVVALVDLVATTHESGALMISNSRLVDALLDARSGAAEPVVAAVDRALTAVGHRSVITVEEALELVAEVTAAERAADSTVSSS
jgi:hypothetical protein